MDELSELKRPILWILGLLFVIGMITWAFNRSDEIVNNGITRYDEFQEIYNTCDKINTDLGNMETLPANDQMFEQFSKAQRVNTLKTELNRWVNTYNANAHMWNKSMWKSNKLPYQLSVTDYSNYK